MTFNLKDVLFLRFASASVDAASSWFFCCTVGVFILPLLLDRLVFYLPRLSYLTRTGEVQSRSVPYTVLEIALWTFVISIVYIGMYYLNPYIFQMITISVPAKLAWTITVFFLIYRTFYFDKIVKRNFYYNAYMRYITPEALHEYQRFIEDVDDLYIDDLTVLLEKELPYMHRQAVLRKYRQVVSAKRSKDTTSKTDSRKEKKKKGEKKRREKRRAA